MKKFLLFILLFCLYGTLAAQKIDTTYCDAPLSEVLRHLNRSQNRYVINFMYDELEEFRVTATIRHKSVPEALAQIVGFYPLSVTTGGKNEIYVESTHRAQPKYTGRLTDENRQPLGYANVALLSPSDSTLLASGVTNGDGRFAIPCTAEKALARISFVGYRTLFIQCTDYELGSIRMQPDTLAIRPVTVDGQMPFLRFERGKLVFDTRQTAGAAYATDLLRYTPGVVLHGNDISLFGSAGVILCINGKEQRLPTAETLQMLKSFSASDVERIEIDQTPGASYSANGKSGVINLVLKKRENDYIGGSVGYAHTQYEEHGDEANANVVFNRGRLSSSLNVAGTWDNTRYLETNAFSTGSSVRDEAQIGRIGNKSYTLRWQADYETSERLSLGAYAFYANGNRKLDVDGEYAYAVNYGQTQDHLAVDLLRTENTNTFALNANALQKLRFKGGKIDYNLDAYRMKMNDMRSSETSGMQSASMGYDFNYWNRILQSVSNYSAKADADIGGFRTGIQYAFTQTDRDLTHSWKSGYSGWSGFVYDEQLFSVYAEYGGSLGERLSYSLGGRYEQNWTKGIVRKIQTTSAHHTRYGHFFPALSLAFKPAARHSLSWSLTSRIERPNILNMNTDTLYYDAFQYSLGNPYLKPSRLYKAMMGYAYGTTLSLDLYYTFQANRLTHLTYASQGPYLYSTWDNAVDEHKWGLNAFYRFDRLRWMNAVLMQGVCWNRSEGKSGHKLPTVQGWTYRGGLQASFFLNRRRNWTAHTSVSYSSRELDAQRTFRTRYQVDAGLQYRCWKERLQLNLTCRNLLASHIRGRECLGSADMIFDNRLNYRQLLLSLAYNWGAKLRLNSKQFSSDEVRKRVVNDF